MAGDGPALFVSLTGGKRHAVRRQESKGVYMWVYGAGIKPRRVGKSTKIVGADGKNWGKGPAAAEAAFAAITGTGGCGAIAAPSESSPSESKRKPPAAAGARSPNAKRQRRRREPPDTPESHKIDGYIGRPASWPVLSAAQPIHSVITARLPDPAHPRSCRPPTTTPTGLEPTRHPRKSMTLSWPAN